MSRYADRGISMELEYGGAPYVPDWPEAHRYGVTLFYQGRTMRTHFYTGEFWEREPDVDDVLKCLCDDASDIVNSEGFEDWASELGHDLDSQRAAAEETYAIAQGQTAKLRDLLGDDFDSIVFDGGHR